MTDLRKSDAQLNAEASQPLEERDLDAAIALHRAAYASDPWPMKLHIRDGEFGVGVPFSPSFAALLDGLLGRYPYSKAMVYLRWRICIATHPEHRSREAWRGALCYRLVDLIIRQGYSLGIARMTLGLPDEAKSRRTLGNALLSIERHLDDIMRREQSRQQQPRDPAEWMGAAHVHRGLDGLHAAECPQCQKGAAA